MPYYADFTVMSMNRSTSPLMVTGQPRSASRRLITPVEEQHTHDQGHPGAGEAIAAGDVRLVSALQLSSPCVPFVSNYLGSLRKSP